MAIKLTVAGSSDAFSSGGRLQPCFHIASGRRSYLLDCGATVLVSLKLANIDPNSVETVVLSHLHGDHFAGLIWLMLYGQHPGRRKTPLTVYGPIGTEARVTQTSELLYPGSTRVEQRFPIRYVEFRVGQIVPFNGGFLRAYEASHPSGSPSTSLRLEHDGRVIAYSGDTAWGDQLVTCSHNADLFITECYAPAPPVSYHLDWQTLSANLNRITAKRVLLTHMSESMLAAPPETSDERVLLASDGMVLEI